MSHMDILMTRQYESQGETKTSYTKVGVAFPLQNGGFRLRFEAIPVPTIYDGKIECSMLMVEPKPRDQQNGQQDSQSSAADYDRAQSGQRQSSYQDDMDDEIPF